jgi:hypothetical protein
MLQVAAQEGAYLADCFNRMNTCEENPEGPLRIRGAGRHRFKPFRSVIKSITCLYFCCARSTKKSMKNGSNDLIDIFSLERIKLRFHV